MHTCPMVSPGPVPHVGGPILPPCAVTVLTGSIPQARVGDMAVCVGPPDSIVKGSATVMVMGSPAARIGDMTAHGGVIVVGLPTVMIGDGAGSGGSPGGTAMVVPRMGAEGQNAAPGQQAKVMIAASEQGTPFCEQCQNA